MLIVIIKKTKLEPNSYIETKRLNYVTVWFFISLIISS
jgi:hypothetical protein